MKNIIKYSILPLIAAMTFSCEVVEISEYADMADCTWHMGTGSSNRDPIVITYNDNFSLVDLSQNYVSHEWIVPEDAGIYMLGTKVATSDTPTMAEVDLSIPYSGNSDAKLHLWFTQAGTFGIRLLNKFDKLVSYSYVSNTTGNTDFTITKYAEEIDGYYVMDTTFTVRVYDPYLNPDRKLYLDAELTQEVVLDDSVTTSISIEYGDKLYFVDDSYDEPNYWYWYCAGLGVSYETANPTFEFKTVTGDAIGEGTPFTFTQKVQRVSDTSNQYLPTASAVTETVPLNVYVLPSTQALSVSRINQVDANNINISLGNAEFDPENLPDASKFSIAWENDYDGADLRTGTVGVSEVTVVEGSAYTINLLLDGDIYNTDRLYLSYSGETAVVNNANLFTISVPSTENVETTYAETYNYDFTDSSEGDDWGIITNSYIGNGSFYSSGVFNYHSVTPYVAADPDDATNNCLISEVTTANAFTSAGTDNAIIVNKNTFTGKDTDYTLTFRYRLDTYYSANIQMSYYGSPYSGWSTDGLTYTTWASNSWISQSAAYNTWVTWSGTISGQTTVEDLVFAFRMNGYRGTVYLDDIVFGNIGIRPDDTVE